MSDALLKWTSSCVLKPISAKFPILTGGLSGHLLWPVLLCSLALQMFRLNSDLLWIWLLCLLHAIGSPAQEAEFEDNFSNSIDYNENFNRDRHDRLTKETEVMVKEEEDQLEYSDYAPEAAALIHEEMEPEEKKGPTLGRVLGAVNCNHFKSLLF